MCRCEVCRSKMRKNALLDGQDVHCGHDGTLFAVWGSRWSKLLRSPFWQIYSKGLLMGVIIETEHAGFWIYVAPLHQPPNQLSIAMKLPVTSRSAPAMM